MITLIIYIIMSLFLEVAVICLNTAYTLFFHILVVPIVHLQKKCANSLSHTLSLVLSWIWRVVSLIDCWSLFQFGITWLVAIYLRPRWLGLCVALILALHPNLFIRFYWSPSQKPNYSKSNCAFYMRYNCKLILY